MATGFAKDKTALVIGGGSGIADVRLDGTRLRIEPGQAVIPHGIDHDLIASANAYVCGPASFMTDMQDALAAIGLDPARIHTELFGALPPVNPGLTGQTRRSPHVPAGPSGTGPLVTFARSGISAPFAASRRSVLTSPTRATSLAAGPAAPASATPAPPRCYPATSPTPRTRPNPQPTARCSSAAPSPAPTSSWTCDKRHDRTTVAGPATESDEIRRCRAAPAKRGRRQPGHRPAAGNRRSRLDRRNNSTPQKSHKPSHPGGWSRRRENGHGAGRGGRGSLPLGGWRSYCRAGARVGE